MRIILNKIWFTLFFVVLYRLGTYVPVPFIDEQTLANYSQISSGVFSLLSGGAHSRVSIFALGVVPYITASIVFHLISNGIPELKASLAQDKKTSTKYVRLISYGLAVVQAFFFIFGLNKMGNMDAVQLIAVFVTLVSSSALSVWIAEKINHYGIGNGVSVIIASGILSEFLFAFAHIFDSVRIGVVLPYQLFLFLIIFVAVLFMIVFVETAIRKIKVNYTRVHQKYTTKEHSYLPIKVNLTGVLPVIFSSTISFFLIYSLSSFSGVSYIDAIVPYLHSDLGHVFITAPLILLFTIFYSSIVFNVEETSQYLKKNNAYVAGYRPGIQTAEYLSSIALRLSYISAVYLLIVTIVPDLFLKGIIGGGTTFSGTSIMICVTVLIDMITRVSAQMVSSRYGQMFSSL